jgi:hypothetical protein
MRAGVHGPAEFVRPGANATGAGAPPWTWPVDEQAIDLAHKAVYAFTTGYLVDRLALGRRDVPAPPTSQEPLA